MDTATLAGEGKVAGSRGGEGQEDSKSERGGGKESGQGGCRRGGSSSYGAYMILSQFCVPPHPLGHAPGTDGMSPWACPRYRAGAGMRIPTAEQEA